MPGGFRWPRRQSRPGLQVGVASDALATGFASRGCARLVVAWVGRPQRQSRPGLQVGVASDALATGFASRGCARLVVAWVGRPRRQSRPGLQVGVASDALAEGEKTFDRLRAEVWAFTDQQMAAVGDHAQRRAETARELEGVGERKLVVAGAPENERPTAKLAELRADVVGDNRAGRADRVARQSRAVEETVDRSAREDQGVGCSPAAEDRVPKEGAIGDRVRPGRHEPARADDAEDAEPVTGPARRRRDPGPGGED